jgi:hypothetical protein
VIGKRRRQKVPIWFIPAFYSLAALVIGKMLPAVEYTCCSKFDSGLSVLAASIYSFFRWDGKAGINRYRFLFLFLMLELAQLHTLLVDHLDRTGRAGRRNH